jgi:hypothetical protein
MPNITNQTFHATTRAADVLSNLEVRYQSEF